jgi:hypothetical protein
MVGQSTKALVTAAVRSFLKWWKSGATLEVDQARIKGDLSLLRIPVEGDHPFRSKATTDSV